MAVINNSVNHQVTQFNTVTGGANNLLNNVSPGTTGQVLTSNGAALQPTYQALLNAKPYQQDYISYTFFGGF